MSSPHNVDVVILGAGLAGLTLAYRLRKSNLSVVLLEARDRVGGRILTRGGSKHPSIEMGATWLGLKHQALVELLKELSISMEPQAMDGRAWYEPNSQLPAQLVSLPHNPEPSFVIKQGSSALIHALHAQLPPKSVLLNQHVDSITKTAYDLVVRTRRSTFNAQVIASTLPPNLFCNSINVSPKLPPDFTAFAKTCHTWMGESIKVGCAFETPFWRSTNSSSTLFSNAGPLTECYEHAHVNTHQYALKGFVKPELHVLKKEERQQLVELQLKRIYRERYVPITHYEECVWQDEHLTFKPYESFVLPHQNNGHPSLRVPQLGGRLLFCGSETAPSHPGYMDGAVEAATLCSNTILQHALLA